MTPPGGQPDAVLSAEQVAEVQDRYAFRVGALPEMVLALVASHEALRVRADQAAELNARLNEVVAGPDATDTATLLEILIAAWEEMHREAKGHVAEAESLRQALRGLMLRSDCWCNSAALGHDMACKAARAALAAADATQERNG